MRPYKPRCSGVISPHLAPLSTALTSATYCSYDKRIILFKQRQLTQLVKDHCTAGSCFVQIKGTALGSNRCPGLKYLSPIKGQRGKKMRETMVLYNSKKLQTGCVLTFRHLQRRRKTIMIVHPYNSFFGGYN